MRKPVNLWNMTDMLVTGTDLKVERIRRGVKATELAARMGVSRSFISLLENRALVPPDKAERYRETLATFPSLAGGQDAA